MGYTTQTEVRQRVEQIQLRPNGFCKRRMIPALAASQDQAWNLKCASRYTNPSVRDFQKRLRTKKQETAINAGRLCDQKIAMLEILAEKPEHCSTVSKVMNCGDPYPCNSKWCPICSDPQLRKDGWRYSDQLKHTKYKCNAVGTKRGMRSGNYVVNAGQRMAEPFDGLPLSLLHAVTVNLTLIPEGGSLETAVIDYRNRLKSTLKNLNPEAIVRGKFDFVLKYADDLNFSIPQCDLPSDLNVDNLPHHLHGMFHAHFVVFDPNLTTSQITEIFKDAFPGNKRVCVRKPKKDVRQPNGTVTQGIQGYLEYASLEKIEINFGSETVGAVLQYADMDATWSRANRNIRYGNRTIKTEAAINTLHSATIISTPDDRLIQSTLSELDIETYWAFYASRFNWQLVKYIQDLKKAQNAGRMSFTSDYIMIVSYLSCDSCPQSDPQHAEYVDLIPSRCIETSGRQTSGCPP